MLSIAICDDDKKGADRLHNLVAQYMLRNNVEYSIHIYDSGEQFLNVDSTRYHALFLGIHINDMNALGAAHQIRYKNKHLMIVLVIDLPQYRIYGEQVRALGCIERNHLEAGLPECLDLINRNKIYVWTQQLQEATHTIEMNGLAREIHVQDIYYFESEKRKLRVYTRTKIFEYYEKLNTIEPMLREKGFIRCHQSYLVNKKYIKEVDLNNLNITLVSGQGLPISKSKRREVEKEYLWSWS